MMVLVDITLIQNSLQILSGSDEIVATQLTAVILNSASINEACVKNLAAIAAIREDWEQNPRWRSVKRGYTATRSQRKAGAGYFDAVTQIIHGGRSSVTALAGSTEKAQFHQREKAAV